MLIMFSLVILILDVLVGVAFLTLLERELLGYFQIREGPNSVGFLGILLPLSDALKLFSEEQSIPLMPNYWIYYFSPIFNLTLSLFLWMIMPFWLGFSSFSISISFIIICIKHPLSQGFLILMYTTLISLTSGLFSSFWYSHIVFLIFIGGLLLLFIYMTSISSNEKFKTNIFLFLKMSKIFSSTMVYSNEPNSFLNEYLIKNMLNNQMKYLNDLYSMSKFLFSPPFKLFVITILFLLITLVAAIKICKLNNGLFAKMFYDNTLTKKFSLN